MSVDIQDLHSLSRSIRHTALLDDLVTQREKKLQSQQEVALDDCVFHHQQDSWDSKISGLRVGKIEHVSGYRRDSILNMVKRFLKEMDYAYLLIRIPQYHHPWIQSFEEQGAILLDSTIDMSLRLRQQSETVTSSINGIHICKSEWLDELVSIAESFCFGRFFTDPKVNYGRKAYREWITNSYKKKAADELFVLKSKNSIDGFVSVTYKKIGDQCIANIPLIAKAPSSKRSGVAKTLLNFVKNRAFKKGCIAATISTQTSNIAAMRAYAEVGFKPYNTGVTLRILKDELS